VIVDMRARGALVAVLLLLVILLVLACSNGEEPVTGEPADDPGPTPAPEAAEPTPDPTPTPTPEPVIPPLTLDGIFPPRDIDALGLDPSRVRTLIATGDVIFARFVNVTVNRRGDDFLYPVREIAPITRDADLTVIQFEAPLFDGCPFLHEGFVPHCGRTGFIDAVLEMGADVATMENNHIGDFGPEGIQATIDLFERHGIEWVRSDRPAIVDVDGLKFGFLAYNGVGPRFDRDAIVAAIQDLRPQVDVLAVAFHWGREYVAVPMTAPGIAEDHPVEIGRMAIDAGADLIIGNHPHWVQAVEIYNGGFIAYAHGNLIYDQMWSYETRVSVIGRYTFYDDQLIGVEYIPTLSHDYAQAVPLEGAEAQAVLDGMRQASVELAEMLEQGILP
jgi:hypothetical protein